ncbi:MAG: hypothetical protein LBT01_02370, partial [Spirochaetaceae bacterium]|nr:hypothetical protein [Spirochaetaceae bacterium]
MPCLHFEKGAASGGFCLCFHFEKGVSAVRRCLRRGIFLLFFTTNFFLAAQSAPPTDNALGDSGALGESAIAEKYIDWAQKAFDEGRFLEAQNALLRAQDYAAFSSDLSYLLALSQRRLQAPRRQVLGNAELALATDRWHQYKLSDARALKARVLLELLQHEAALSEIDALPESAEKECLRLEALRQMKRNASFRAAAVQAMQTYPEDTTIVSLVFKYAQGRIFADAEDAALVETALKRLPVLLERRGSLIYEAAPFMADTEEARRQQSARAAVGVAPPPAAAPRPRQHR